MNLSISSLLVGFCYNTETRAPRKSIPLSCWQNEWFKLVAFIIWINCSKSSPISTRWERWPKVRERFSVTHVRHVTSHVALTKLRYAHEAWCVCLFGENNAHKGPLLRTSRKQTQSSGISSGHFWPHDWHYRWCWRYSPANTQVRYLWTCFSLTPSFFILFS